MGALRRSHEQILMKTVRVVWLHRLSRGIWQARFSVGRSSRYAHVFRHDGVPANTLGGRDVDYVQDLYYCTAMLHDALSGTTVSRSCNECTQCSSGVLQFSPPDDNAPISCGAWLNCRLKQVSAAHEDTLCTDVANDISAECCVVPVRVSQFL